MFFIDKRELILASAFLVLFSCEKKESIPENNVFCKTGEASEIKVESATLSGIIHMTSPSSRMDPIGGYLPSGSCLFYISSLQLSLEEMVSSGTVYEAKISDNYTSDIPFYANLEGLEGETTYFFLAASRYNGEMYYGDINTFTTWPSRKHVDGAVDLGLSVLWASSNLGASSSEEVGNFYAWGETEPKNEFTEENYRWGKDVFGFYTKYGRDKNYTLALEDDAAHIAMGGKWRMPTAKECDELKRGTKAFPSTQNGVDGMVFKSSVTGESIFVPYSDVICGETGVYDPYPPTALQSSSLVWPWLDSYRDSDYLSAVFMMASRFTQGIMDGEWPRYYGMPIRPVYEDGYKYPEE